MGADLEKGKRESWRMFDEIAGTYDLLNSLLSFGGDTYWRSGLIKGLPPGRTLSALDLATGTGDVALALAGHPRIAKVLGLDLSAAMIARARRKALRSANQDKITFAMGDGQELNLPGEGQDVVTVAFGLRNFPRPKDSLKEIHRVLRPGGRAMILEFSNPSHPLWRSLYLLYLRHLLPTVGRLVSRHREAYRYLNRTVEAFPSGEGLAAWMREAGLAEVRFESFTGGIVTLYSGEKR